MIRCRLLVLLFQFLATFMLISSCSEDKNTITSDDSDENSNGSSNEITIEIEKQKIVNTYLQFSQRVISKDYEGALALIEKNSAAISDLKNMKYKWDDGKTAYYSFFNIQSIIDQPLLYGMGWAQGDVTIVLDQEEYHKKFTSSCIRENSQWLISAIHFQER